MSKKECMDKKCPIHGSLSTRGQAFTGVVVSDKMDGTVIIDRKYSKKVPKYDRYMHSSTRFPAHNPPCIKARKGDVVSVMECRKLSRTVSSVVTGVIGKEDLMEIDSIPKKVKSKKPGKQAEKQSEDGDAEEVDG